MELSKKMMKDIKTALETDHGRPFSDEEIENVADFLKRLAEMQVEIFLEDEERQQRLTESPGGFHLEKKGYSCRICHGAASGKNSWFDEYGLKCGSCQEAINQKVIPPSVATDPDSWYSAYELESNFGLTAPIRRKWIKKGLLIVREILGSAKRPELQLFLISDNMAMLPPKHLVRGHMVREVIDGREWHSSRPWYWFVDPHEHLKGYEIVEYLRFVPSGNVDGRSAPI
jgi:hypothetical protein